MRQCTSYHTTLTGKNYYHSENCLQRNHKGPKCFPLQERFRLIQVPEVWILERVYTHTHIYIPLNAGFRYAQLPLKPGLTNIYSLRKHRYPQHDGHEECPHTNLKQLSMFVQPNKINARHTQHL